MTWRLRRSPVVRQVLRFFAVTCVVVLGVVALVTAAFVAVFGHPVVWSVIGVLFAALPLAGLLLVVSVGLRAAVAAGPGWIGVRVVRRWRVIDLSQVRTVRLADGAGFGGAGFGGFPGGRFGGSSVVFEDDSGGRVDIGVDALGSGIAEVVLHGLGPEVDIDPDAARALEQGDDPTP